MSNYLVDDPIKQLLDRGPSAKIVADPINGYDKVVLDKDILEEAGMTYAQSVRETDRDLEPQHKEIVDNQLVYDCQSSENEVITVPVAKRIANQQMAWGSTAILSKDPYISVKALDDGSYEIPTQIYEGEVVPGFEHLGPIPQYELGRISAEEAAKLYQRLLQYDFTELIDFEQLVEDTEFAIHVGENPTWWKVPYSPKVRHAKQRAMRQSGETATRVQFFGVEDTTITEGKTVDICHVYGPNITTPVGENDEQKAWWLAEKTPLTNIDLWEGFKKGIYDLGLEPGEEVPQSEILQILGFAENLQEADESRRTLAQVDRIVAQNPRREHDVRTLWFYHPIHTENGIEIRSLCGTLHMKSGRFLNLYVNPYWHGKRPYVPFFMQRKPHQLRGYSSVGNVAPLQRLVSSIFHLQINNQVQQNMKVFLVRENSATWRYMNKPSFQLKPGIIIPYEAQDDVSPHQLGSPIQSMAAEITFLDDTADKLTVSRDYAQIPNRTPAATVAQIDATATVQPSTILRGMRRSIAKAVKMYFQTVAQFHHYRTIPFLDPDTNHLVTQLIGFPRNVIENQFSFRVTATGDDDTRQAKQEKTLLNLAQTDRANEAALKLMDIILDPQTPPEASEFATFLLLRRERLYGELIENSRLDTHRFVVNEQLIVKLREAAQANQPPPQPPTPPEVPAGLPPTPQQGGINAAPPQLPPTAPGPAIPQLPAGPPGPSGPPGEPVHAGVGQPGPQQAPFALGQPTAV